MAQRTAAKLRMVADQRAVRLPPALVEWATVEPGSDAS
jgi:hypothetical protein